MLERPITTLKGSLAFIWLITHTFFLCVAMLPVALLKFALPFTAARRITDRTLNALAATWVRVNGRWIAAVGNTGWDVRGVQDLRPDRWYLVSSNHRSWVDILVLQTVLDGHVPFMKFFLKRELIWVPVIGLAWWALDFPFLRRRHGAAGQSDLETARRACERFTLVPTSVINFAEGTRFTTAKHDAQRSPYAHLLKPKAGGMAIALVTLGDRCDAVLDVTLFYRGRTPSFWDLLAGRVRDVVVQVQARPIPAALLDEAAQNAPRYRSHVQAWLDSMWREKDRVLDAFTQQRATPAP